MYVCLSQIIGFNIDNYVCGVPIGVGELLYIYTLPFIILPCTTRLNYYRKFDEPQRQIC